MVVVIGATSFIGMYTVDELISNGIDVIATGRNERLKPALEKLGATFVSLDITKPRDFDRLPSSGVDGVILLAGLLPANATADLKDTENAADYFKVNTLGTVNVLEYCRKNGIKKIISTTTYGDVSGAWGKGYAITEDEPRNFKFTGDHAVYTISMGFKVRSSGSRRFTAWGPMAPSSLTESPINPGFRRLSNARKAARISSSGEIRTLVATSSMSRMLPVRSVLPSRAKRRMVSTT